jgi:hypothetical protein
MIWPQQLPYEEERLLFINGVSFYRIKFHETKWKKQARKRIELITQAIVMMSMSNNSWTGIVFADHLSLYQGTGSPDTVTMARIYEY